MEFETLKNIIAEVLQVDPDEISMDTTFDDLGGDSLDLYQIILEVQDKLSVEVDEEKVAEIKTVGEAVELIQDAEYFLNSRSRNPSQTRSCKDSFFI